MINYKQTKLSLKQHRINNKLTQLELAEKLDVSRQSVEVWESERNSTIPSLKHISMLCKIYDVEFWDLLIVKKKGE